MARAVHRQPAEVNMDYVNLPEPSVTINASKGNEGNHNAGGKTRNKLKMFYFLTFRISFQIYFSLFNNCYSNSINNIKHTLSLGCLNI